MRSDTDRTLNFIAYLGLARRGDSHVVFIFFETTQNIKFAHVPKIPQGGGDKSVVGGRYKEISSGLGFRKDFTVLEEYIYSV